MQKQEDLACLFIHNEKEFFVSPSSCLCSLFTEGALMVLLVHFYVIRTMARPLQQQTYFHYYYYYYCMYHYIITKCTTYNIIAPSPEEHTTSSSSFYYIIVIIIILFRIIMSFINERTKRYSVNFRLLSSTIFEILILKILQQKNVRSLHFIFYTLYLISC